MTGLVTSSSTKRHLVDKLLTWRTSLCLWLAAVNGAVFPGNIHSLMWWYSGRLGLFNCKQWRIGKMLYCNKWNCIIYDGNKIPLCHEILFFPLIVCYFGHNFSRMCPPANTKHVYNTFIQRRTYVFDVGPTLYNCFTNAGAASTDHSVRLCSQRYLVQIPVRSDICHRRYAYTVLQTV